MHGHVGSKVLFFVMICRPARSMAAGPSSSVQYSARNLGVLAGSLGKSNFDQPTAEDASFSAVIQPRFPQYWALRYKT